MDKEVWTALASDLLAGHRGLDWEFVQTADALAIELQPIADPSRCARVTVSASTEVVSYSFAGHQVSEFAYDLQEKHEVLADTISRAVAAVRGPTQVLLEWAGPHVVRSAISHHTSGDPLERFTTSFPIARLWSRIRGRRIRREVLTFPALPDMD
ncbi:MAG: hypothetical protein AAGC63_02230 [Propionicimonas sp.]|nr:hypothetical protein [Propionicimonas sp.]